MRSQLTLISMNYVFRALVDASGRAELYGTTDRSIPIDWSIRAGLAFSMRSPPICWLCKIPSYQCWEHQCLVWSLGRAELYGTIDQSIDPDRLVCTSRISILKASTPNILIVQDPFVSSLRAPMPCLKHWWMPRDELSFMALQICRSIPIDWSVRAGLAFSRRPPLICWLCKIPWCRCWEHQRLVRSIGGCLGTSWVVWHYRPIDRSRSIDLDRLVCTSQISILVASTPYLLIVQDPFLSLLRAPMPCLEDWWMPRDELSFMALQTDKSISIDWSVRAGLAFSKHPPPICWLCMIPSCHCWEYELVLCEKQMLIPSCSCKLLIHGVFGVGQFCGSP